MTAVSTVLRSIMLAPTSSERGMTTTLAPTSFADFRLDHKIKNSIQQEGKIIGK